MKPRRVMIINADDLGYSAARDEGIFLAFQNGCVTSASLLVNGYTSISAAKEAIRIGLPLGLHLNLTEGVPVSNRASSLIDGETGVMRGKQGFRDACHTGTVNLKEVKTEILAQIDEFRRLTNTVPTHVDGHQHCHILKETREVFAEAMKQARTPLRTRLPQDSPLYMEEVPNRGFLESVIESSYEAAEVFRANGINFPDCFMGLSLSWNSSLEKVWSSLMCVPVDTNNDIVCEWMAHPGNAESVSSIGGFAPDCVPDDFARSDNRLLEYQVLTDPRLRRLLEDTEGFTLGSFSTIDRPVCENVARRTCCILTSATPSTGNHSTAVRLRKYLTGCGWRCLIIDANEIGDQADWDRVLRKHQVDVVLGIHAYRAGKFLVQSSFEIPFVLILGGTDMNEMIHAKEKREVMAQALNRACAIVAFVPALANRARELLVSEFGRTSKTIVIIPQTVVLPRTSYPIAMDSESNSLYFKQLCAEAALSRNCKYVEGGPVLLLPLGIRAVKDPMYLIDAVIQHLPELNLILVGPALDPILAEQVISACRKNVTYVGSLQRDELLDAMSRSDIVVNCSLSEGMSNTILEAMAIQGPLVIARDIEGNRALITHGENGLLFTTPIEFVSMVKQCLSDSQGKKRMVLEAKKRYLSRFSEEKEREMYNRLLLSALDTPRKGTTLAGTALSPLSSITPSPL